MDISYSSLSAFGGVYAYIPAGYRPRARTGYTPAVLATSAALMPGTAVVEQDGRVYIDSAGVKASQVVYTGVWIV